MLMTRSNYLVNDDESELAVYAGRGYFEAPCPVKVENPFEAGLVTPLHDEYPVSTAAGSSADIPRDTQLVETSPLIAPPSYCRHTSPRDPPSTPTLFPSHLHLQHQRRDNGISRFLVNASSPSDHRDLTTSHGSLRSSIESSSLSPFSPQNVSITTPSHRLRTYPPVFHSTSDLAAHHGIPQSLPPLPRTTRISAEPTIKSPPPLDAFAQSSSSNDFDFQSLLCNNYLAMLAKNPEEAMSATSAANLAQDGFDAIAAREVMDVLLDAASVSPDFGNYEEFLTGSHHSSPLEDFNDFLATPVSGYLTNPDVFEGDDFNDSNGFNGFASLPLFPSVAPHPTKPPPIVQSGALLQPSVNLDDAKYTMLPSPTTPSLDPSSLHPSPRIESLPPPSNASVTKRKGPAPTGTRKNITPDALVPMDAPIQTRKYVTPSATSRKEVPAVFAKKKRSRSSAFGEEEDQIVDISQLDPNDLEAIEAKRRQNTLAARRSRKRKLEYQQELEASVDKEREEKEMWKARAMMFHAMLINNGVDAPTLEH